MSNDNGIIHHYKALAHPMAQIEAASEFCASITAYMEDEWDEKEDGPPPDISKLNPVHVLTTLCKLKLRFEYAQDHDEPVSDGYFALSYRGNKYDEVLYHLAYKFSDKVLPKAPERFVLTNGMSWDDFIVVPDREDVVAEALQLCLMVKDGKAEDRALQD
jgi:hypothetical protein